MGAQKSRDHAKRFGSDALWNAAAVLGLLLIGLVLGGVLGILLDRQGLFGEPRGAGLEAALPPAAVQTGGSESRTPLPLPPRLPGDEEAFDREALEAALQKAEGDGPPAESRPARAGEEIPEFLPAITVPDRGLTGPAPWQANAVPVAVAQGRPMVAIVLDDVGVNRRNARASITLPAPLTLSFMTYAEDLTEMTEAARMAGHELMLHVPMQPLSPLIDPGPNVLTDSLPATELTQRLVWGLERFEGYVGINNHMGSRFHGLAGRHGFGDGRAEGARSAVPRFTYGARLCGGPDGRTGRRPLRRARCLPGQRAERPHGNRSATRASGANRPRAGLRPWVLGILIRQPGRRSRIGSLRCRRGALPWYRSPPWCSTDRAWQLYPQATADPRADHA